MRSNTVPITSPCHESWDAMEGGEARRFCGVCQKDVHNLSAMAQAEAQALLGAHAGEHLCVRYSSESDGTLRFRDLVPKASLLRRIVRTAFAASMLAACTPYAGTSDIGHEVIEAIRAATVATADGGCDYATGPLTSFHLPPGHVLCQQAGPQEGNGIESADPPVQPPMMGEPLVMPPPEMVPSPVEPPMMGAMVEPPPAKPVSPAKLVRSSAPPMKMGGMMMAPRRAPKTFVPCDPKSEAKSPKKRPPEQKGAAPVEAPEEAWMGDFVPPAEMGE